jgi:hypothetical protein
MAVFERLCPASNQVVFQGSVLRMLAAGEFAVMLKANRINFMKSFLK